MKNTMLIALLVSTLLLGGVVQAQDDVRLDADQRAALDTVNAAINGLSTTGSYAASGTHEQHQITHLIDDNRSQDSHSSLLFETEFHFTAAGELAAAQGRLGNTGSVQTDDERTYRTQVVASFIVIEDQLYQKFTLAPPALVSGYDEGPFLNQWHVLSAIDLLAINRYEYGSNAFALQSFAMPSVTPTLDAQLRVSGMLDPLDEGLVLDAVALRDDVVDGQLVVVYEVMLDPFPVQVEQIGGMLFGATDLTEAYDADTFQALVEIMREQQHITHRYWIGTDDQRLYRIEMLTMGEYNTHTIRDAIPALSDAPTWPQENVTFVTDNEFAITFSAFGKIAPIAAPPDADPFMAWYE